MVAPSVASISPAPGLPPKQISFLLFLFLFPLPIPKKPRARRTARRRFRTCCRSASGGSPASGIAAPVPSTARSYRLTFEKLGDARYLSHRNTMDVLERALRASGAPVRYTEGYNPHLRMSMGPALPLGHESKHELFDVDVEDVLTKEHVRPSTTAFHRESESPRLPSSRRARNPSAAPRQRRSTRSRCRTAKGAPRGSLSRARRPRRQRSSWKRTYGVPPEGQHAVRVTRLETVLQS